MPRNLKAESSNPNSSIYKAKMNNKSVVGNPTNWRYASSRSPANNTNSLVSFHSHTSNSRLQSQCCNSSSASSKPRLESKLIEQLKSPESQKSFFNKVISIDENGNQIMDPKKLIEYTEMHLSFMLNVRSL